MLPIQSSLHFERQSPRAAAATRSRHSQPGFTLVELLVVVVIVITLAFLTLAVVIRMRERANNILAVSNMRQIGSAISSYLSENDHLPAFNDAGVSPALSTADPLTQAYVLQPYLGLAEPTATVQYPEVFRAPGLKPENMGGKKKWYEVVAHAMYSTEHIHASKAYLPTGVVTDTEGQDVGPFGRVGGTATSPGWKTGQLDAGLAKYSADNGGKIATLSMVPAMLEINAEHPSIAGSWPWPVPQKTLRGSYVNVLYFDWRVESVAPTFFYEP